MKSPRQEPPIRREPPLLLYDGLCGFCNGTVRLILRHDPSGSMRFAPLQGSTTRSILDRRPDLAGVDSLILLRHVGAMEVAHIRSDAIVEIARYLGGPWLVASLLRIVPRFVRDRAYALFARYRYRLFDRFETCPVPEPNVRARFLP